MLIVQSKLSYKCATCNRLYAFEDAVPPKSLKAVSNLNKGRIKCACCSTGLMYLVKASHYFITDVFGDEQHGFWYCSSHETRLYYPYPLRLASMNMKEDLRRNFGSVADLYIKIAKKQFPWKCPICETAKGLIYRDYGFKVVGSEDDLITSGVIGR